MNEKRDKKPEKFTDVLRPWIVARDTEGNLVIGREVIEGIRCSGRTKRCFIVEGLPPQGAVGTNYDTFVDFNARRDDGKRLLNSNQRLEPLLHKIKFVHRDAGGWPPRLCKGDGSMP